MAGKYNFTYESEIGSIVNVRFEAETVIDVVDEFKYFLKGSGFHENCVNDIRYGDDDICIIKDRIKSALENLESIKDSKDELLLDKINRAEELLNDAYNT